MSMKLLCLAPVLLLAYFELEVKGQPDTDRDYHDQTISDSAARCGPCKVGYHCIHENGANPNNTPAECVKIECTISSECRSHQFCLNQHCANPCDGACGVNANCDVRHHISVCSCPLNYTGDPFSECEIAKPDKVFDPSPSEHCLEGFKGIPPNCRHECETDSECHEKHSCRDFKCVSPCSDCGVNADCETTVAHRAICKCPRNYYGDPYKTCTPECSLNSECPRDKPTCVYHACINPCDGACGVNADCRLINLTPVCSCPSNLTGDPFAFCRPFEARDPCKPSPCGADANCRLIGRKGAEIPVCSCPAGFIGNPFLGCNKGECELDSQCKDNLACVGYQCVDPCVGNTQCGSGAVCKARRHHGACACQTGRVGDALVHCYLPNSAYRFG